jgi:hypothetical protein
MARWRSLASLVVLLILSAAGQAQTCNLSEAPLVDSHHRIQLSLALTGTLKLQQDGKEISLKESATAMHAYWERLLEAGPDGAAGKSARFYQEANVAIAFEKDKVECTLRPDRAFLIAQRGRDGVSLFSARGPLTREELDVTDHFDTLHVAGLLPGKEVAVGDTWKIANSIVQALCHLQGLSEHTLTGKLEQVKDDVATFSVTGDAAGIDQGAAVKATVKATCKFDVKERRLTAVEWTQKDERGPGPVSPAASLELTIKLTRTPVEPVNELSDVALVPVPAGPPPREMTDLILKDARDRFELRHAREWQLVARTDDHTVLRLMDRGEFVAQVAIAPWKKAAPGKHLSPDDIKTIVANSPGWEQDKLLKAEEVALPDGPWCYLVAGEGDLDGLRAVQYFYVLAAASGEQAILTFSMTPAQTQKLGSRDLELVRGFALK